MAESETQGNVLGYLEPLSVEDPKLPKISIYQGHNFIGRHNLLPIVSDNRLSRNHILIQLSHGSAHLRVEGSNPVVVTSLSGQRNKLFSRQGTIITFGDIIELIPGHYFFKYLPLPALNKPSSPPHHNKRSTSTYDIHGFNKKRPPSYLTTNLQSKEVSSFEAIRHFNVSKEQMHLTFRLLRVPALPAWANTSSVSISDVIQGNFHIAVLSNYMVDVDWLIAACPALKNAPHVLVIHGESDGLQEHVKRNNLPNWNLHRPPLPISYGTHHSKAMFLVYPRGVRIIIHTANLIHVDWNNKSQGLWMQDFPWKDQSSPSKECGFETDLFDYLNALKWPGFKASLPGHGEFYFNASFFKKFDYTSAAVRLIASVPGYHTGQSLKKWGHMKLRTILQNCVFDKKFQKSPLVYQFSSLGSLDEKWMAEFASSMSSGVSEDRKPLGLGEAQIIWPAVEDVRCSLEGYAAGSAIPSPLKNVEKGFLKNYWAKWKASHSGRCRAMPHIKTFTRYNGQELAWFLLTSANLSKAAWGALQKNNTQLMIRSYELGVLFVPSFVKHEKVFSCTDDGSPSKVQDKSMESESSEVDRTKLVTLAWQGRKEGDSSQVIPLPVPYELPPQPYSSEDIPWSWDRSYQKKDVYGQVWPRHVQLYTSQDS